MAPALTELSSQTNKLSSSATSASPRPSSNISESVSVSTALGNLIATNHNNNCTSQPSHTTELTAFDVSHTPNSAKKFFKADRKDTFQSAFEKFQQIRQQQENIVNNSPKSKILKFDSKSSLKSIENPAFSSKLNGRVPNCQMGPMCDINIEFQEIDFVKKENKTLQLVKNRVETVATHMDLSDTVKINDLKGTQSDDGVPSLKHNNEIIRERIEILEQPSIQVHGSQDKVGDIQEYNDGPDQQKNTRPESVSTKESAVPNNCKTVNTSTPSLNLQTTTSSMGLQKDFIKESADMEQVLGELGTSDMDLLQVLKGFDSTPGGEGAFCELSLFTDVDVMNYEEVPIQQPKDSETLVIRQEIEKRQLQMQRKCDFLLRRLRKIQARYMGRHATEEIAGLFEWQANPTSRRKEPNATHSSYEEDKRHQISTAVMKSFVRRIKNVAEHQHSSLSMKRNKIGRPSNVSIQSNLNVSQHKLSPVVPQINESLVAELSSVSGHLHCEFIEINSAIDSDATASSSGGDSADEMEQFNNTLQQHLPISKRAAWTWIRDRAAIASRWTWLLAQISDLEYRIRQHNDLHNQIRKNKGLVCFDKGPPATTPPNSPILPSSVNGFRGVLPGNSKPLDSDIPTGVTTNGSFASLSSNNSGSCRTHAFQRTSFRKRKLLQTANVHTVSKKAARPSSVKCGCQWPLHPCGLCTGRSDPTAPRDLPDTMTSSEKVALLDSAFHPVLSFPEDVSQSIHVEATVRLPEWQNRVVRCTSKATTSTVKGTVSAQKTDREERSKKYVDSRRKCNRKFPQDVVVANKLLKNSKARRPFQGDQCNNNLLKNKHRKVSTSIASSCGLLIGVGFNNGVGLSSTSCTGGSDSILDIIDTSNGQLPRSKNSSPTPGNHISNYNKSERMDRRNRNSYDIDNIVIPYSVAAATRVEILPYKEIPTPKWRILDDSVEIENCPVLKNTEHNHLDEKIDRSECTITPEKQYNATSLYSIHENNNDEFEDISNEAFLIRHERALIEERKKFQTYLKYPWSTRSRANRRTDSRAESSGANTPDPSSPAPNTPNPCGDLESVPSPSAPSTPQTPIDMGDENSVISQGTSAVPAHQLFNASSSVAKKTERKRTASGRKEREQSKEEMVFNIISEQKESILPYEPLEFPLSDDVYKTMLELMPIEHHILEGCLQRNTFEKALENGAMDKQMLTNEENNPTQMDDIEDRNLAISDEQDSIVLNLLNIERNGNLIAGDSDTDSAESGIQYEDPNDPEWREPE